MSMQPCDLHDLSNCAICNGTERRFQESLKETPVWTRRREAADAGGPRRSGPTIAARFDGHCAGCGRSYGEGDFITHSRDDDGWIAECCS